MLDDFICTQTIEELSRDYFLDDTWYEVEYHFCEELGIEAECYED